MSEKLKLTGLNVIYFESRHAKTIGDLIRLNGGIPVSAPALKEVPLENNPAAFSFAEKLFKNEIDILILLTGVGTRALLQALETRYSRERVLEAFRKISIVPRGPKPIRVLNEWKVPFALTVPEPNTWRELLAALDEAMGTPCLAKQGVPLNSLQGRRVAVQEYGIANPDLMNGLEQRGAKVLPVPVYRWALPDDTKPLENAIYSILEGKAHVVLFTTSVQADHLFKVAAGLGVESKLKDAFRRLVVASVGPDCSETLRAHGLSVDIEPADPKMGPLVKAVAEKAKEVLKWKQKT